MFNFGYLSSGLSKFTCGRMLRFVVTFFNQKVSTMKMVWEMLVHNTNRERSTAVTRRVSRQVVVNFKLNNEHEIAFTLLSLKGSTCRLCYCFVLCRQAAAATVFMNRPCMGWFLQTRMRW